MCFFGGAKAAPAPKKPEFADAPPVVTGEQTGVDKPKDTKKATEELKIRRQKKEGTYIDPNLSRTEELLTGRRSGGGLGAKAKSERSARLRSGVTRGSRPPSKAQKMAAARKAMKSKR